MTQISSEQKPELKVAYDTPWGPIFWQPENAAGYLKTEVPLGGSTPIFKEVCNCETIGLMSCGCGFGKCAKGLIF